MKDQSDQMTQIQMTNLRMGFRGTVFGVQAASAFHRASNSTHVYLPRV